MENLIVIFREKTTTELTEVVNQWLKEMNFIKDPLFSFHPDGNYYICFITYKI